MAIAALGTGKIIAPPAAYAEVPALIASTMGEHLKFGYWFNTFEGESPEEAGVRTSINAARAALITGADRVWVNSEPLTFFPDYARGRNDQPLRNRIMLPPRGSIFVCARTTDTTLGATAQRRAPIVCTYGSAVERGLILEFASWNTGQVRALTFGATNPMTALVTAVQSGLPNLDLWRIYYVGWDEFEIEIACLSGDMGADPAPVALPGGHLVGTRPFTMFGRETIGVNYDPDVHKDIAFLMGFTRRATLPQRNILELQCEAVMAETNLTLLAA